MSTNLSQLKPGQSCVVSRVEGEGMVRRRLFDMGITPGVTIRVRKIAPLGDPMELTLRGYRLSLRREEAAPVIVEMLSEKEADAGRGCYGRECSHSLGYKHGKKAG